MLPNTMACTLTAVPQLLGNVVHAAIYVGTRVVPGTENGLDRFDQLLLGILREVFALLLLIEGLELLHQLLSYRPRPDRYPCLTPFASFTSSMIVFEFASSACSITTSENIWMKRR